MIGDLSFYIHGSYVEFNGSYLGGSEVNLGHRQQSVM